MRAQLSDQIPEWVQKALGRLVVERATGKKNITFFLCGVGTESVGAVGGGARGANNRQRRIKK